MENRENQVEKYINLLHQLLHHLPINLRRFITNYTYLGKKPKMKKAPESLKYQGLKAYEGI